MDRELSSLLWCISLRKFDRFDHKSICFCTSKGKTAEKAVVAVVSSPMMMCATRPVTKMQDNKKEETTTAATSRRKSRAVGFINLALEISETDTPEKVTTATSMLQFQSPSSLQANVSLSSSSSPSPPPLDLVTICSDDSVTSFSSVSEEDEDDVVKKGPLESSAGPVAPTKRCLFKEYWTQTGGGPASFLKRRAATTATPLPPPSIVIVPAQDEENCVNTHGDNNTTHESNKPRLQQQPQQAQAVSRRSIFSKNVVKAQSMPLLDFAVAAGEAAEAAFKRNKSTSALSKSSTRSCLRPCRYSGDKQQRRSRTDSFMSDSSERSVIFSKEVKVALFQKPQERYAAEGWSDYFA